MELWPRTSLFNHSIILTCIIEDIFSSVWLEVAQLVSALFSSVSFFNVFLVTDFISNR